MLIIVITDIVIVCSFILSLIGSLSGGGSGNERYGKRAEEGAE